LVSRMTQKPILYRVRLRDGERVEWVRIWAGARAMVHELHEAAIVAGKAKGMAGAVPDLIEYERQS